MKQVVRKLKINYQIDVFGGGIVQEKVREIKNEECFQNNKIAIRGTK